MTANLSALYHHGRTFKIQQTQTGVEQMNSDKILVKVPWSKVALLVATLIRSAKGGITKDEAEELLEQLGDIIVHLAVGMK